MLIADGWQTRVTTMSGPLSPADLQAAIDADDPIAVIDVRETLDYAEGHITECTLITRRELEERLPIVVPNRQTPVVLVDRAGDRAPLDAEWLSQLGYENVTWLAGGMAAWNEADRPVVEAEGNVHSTAFNFESKKFGELVEAREDLPKVQPEEFEDRFGDEDPLVVDVRTPREYNWITIPGSINVEGVDLGLYIEELREDPDRPVVVHCAGRTRSIIGTATLKKLGVSNVYELENGTMGWELAGKEPEIGAERRVSDAEVDPKRYDEIRASAEGLLEENDIEFVTPADLETLESDVAPEQTIYRFDVRTEGEYADGHVPDAISVPGGQLIQTTDQHIAVRDAAIVLISDTHVRSAITAYWLAEMGFEQVTVLEGGLEAWTESGRPTEAGSSPTAPLGESLVEETAEAIDVDGLADCLDRDECTVIDIDDSESYEEEHIEGASWLPRYSLESAIESGELDADSPLVLVSSNERHAAYAATALDVLSDHGAVSYLEGGTAAWIDAGRPTASGTDGMLVEPRDAVMKPYFQGEAEMRAYLEWEKELAEG